MVYQWLTGKSPFEGDLLAIIGQKLNQDAPALRSHVPSLPAAVEAVVLRALARHPAARYPSVRDFAQALQGAASPPAPPPTPPPTAPQKTKQQWWEEGKAHRQAGRYQEALAAHEHALRLDPTYATAWN